jgi:AmmeMemoRadiSam system protein B
MQSVRQPAVAGTFYPGLGDNLLRAVQALVDAVPREGRSTPAAPKALIVPHAGYR